MSMLTVDGHGSSIIIQSAIHEKASPMGHQIERRQMPSRRGADSVRQWGNRQAFTMTDRGCGLFVISMLVVLALLAAALAVYAVLSGS